MASDQQNPVRAPALESRLKAVLPEGLEQALHGEGDAENDREAARILTRLINIMGVVMMLLGGGFIYMVKDGQPEDRFYAMSFDGKKVQMQSLDTPSLNTNALLAWASDAAATIMTFGFNDINTKFNVSRNYFTEVGWGSFYDALVKSDLLYRIMDQQQLMTAIPSGTPELVYEGMRKGKYVWDVHVPLVLTVRAGGAVLTAKPDLTVTIVKVPTTVNPRGIGIEQWTLI